MDCKCNHCGYEWVARTEGRPKACPACKRYYWDREKKQKGQKGQKGQENDN